eukprot:m.363634 g.363634  ORF g.363634 m.363634 type:complete len:73 (-) comp23338_c0_seq1:1422-1640(-)
MRFTVTLDQVWLTSTKSSDSLLSTAYITTTIAIALNSIPHVQFSLDYSCVVQRINGTLTQVTAQLRHGDPIC